MSGVEFLNTSVCWKWWFVDILCCAVFLFLDFFEFCCARNFSIFTFGQLSFVFFSEMGGESEQGWIVNETPMETRGNLEKLCEWKVHILTRSASILFRCRTKFWRPCGVWRVYPCSHSLNFSYSQAGVYQHHDPCREIVQPSNSALSHHFRFDSI